MALWTWELTFPWNKVTLADCDPRLAIEHEKKGGLPRWLNAKEPVWQCRRLKRHRFDPRVRKSPWSEKWQPTPVFLPGESHRQRSLVGCSPWGHRESDTTEQLNAHTHTHTHTGWWASFFPGQKRREPPPRPCSAIQGVMGVGTPATPYCYSSPQWSFLWLQGPQWSKSTWKAESRFFFFFLTPLYLQHPSSTQPAQPCDCQHALPRGVWNSNFKE